MKVKKLFVEGGRQRQKKKNSARVYRVKMKKFLFLKAAARSEQQRASSSFHLLRRRATSLARLETAEKECR